MSVTNLLPLDEGRRKEARLERKSGVCNYICCLISPSLQQTQFCSLTLCLWTLATLQDRDEIY